MLKGSTIVTGATGSMGQAAVRALVAEGENVIAVCRSREKGEQMVSSVIADFPDASLELAVTDLSSISSVKNFSESMQERRINGLFNNAGTLLRDYTLSEDGIEMCVAVNYVAPFILCNSIGHTMAPGGRIVNMVSLTCRFASLNRHFFTDGKEEYSQLGTYAKSKLALMMFSVEFAKQHPQLMVNMADPGIVNSNMISMGRWFDPLADILFRPLCKSPEKGVAPALRALKTDVSGKLFVGNSIRNIPDVCAGNSDLAWLWAETCSKIDHISSFF